MLFSAKSQTSIDEIYNEFQSGNYQKVIDNRNSLFNDKSGNYSDADKILLEKLVIASYYKIDSNQVALKMTGDFLKKNPNYICNKATDIVEFCTLLESYEVNNEIEFNLDFGLHKDFFKVDTFYTVMVDGNYSNKFKSSIRTYFNVGGTYRTKFGLNASIKTGMFNMRYSRLIEFENGSLDYEENLNYWSTSVDLNYTLIKKIKKSSNFVIRKYLDLGINYNLFYLMNVRSDFNLNQSLPTFNSDVLDTRTRSLANYDMSTQRKVYNHFIGFSQSFKIYLNSIGITFGLDELIQLNQLNFGPNRYSDEVLAIDYYYVDSDFKSFIIIPRIGINYVFKNKINL